MTVVDETLIKVGGSYSTGSGWRWAERQEAPAMALTQTRNALIARSILKELKRRYGRVKVVGDAGRWYPWAAKTLELEHEILSGGVRSYVERIIETIKDRIRVFDKYFPCRCSKPVHVSNFLRLYGLF